VVVHGEIDIDEAKAKAKMAGASEERYGSSRISDMRRQGQWAVATGLHGLSS
jgi:hypothetical protein